jgi:hypothetical protein
MAEPGVQRPLSEAIALVGTCQDMCPEYERVLRIEQNDVWRLENVGYSIESNRGQTLMFIDSRQPQRSTSQDPNSYSR